MQSELIAALAAAIACASATAHADDDIRALVAADSYVARSSELDAADVAWSAHLEWRSPERGATLDWVERESLVGGTPRRELHELAYVDRSIDHVAITAGRFRVPGGFWLIADGAELAARWGRSELGVFGGSRSFTNGRRETLLTRSPHPLPLAGAALTIRGDVQATIAYTYTSDLVDLYRGDGTIVSASEPEQFVDGELLALIGDRGVITAGATAGTRYLVSYPTTPEAIADDPTLQNIAFGSQSAYALVDYKLDDDWRVESNVAVLRTKLGQVADPIALAAFAGSFAEASARVGWRSAATWRADARYRVRVWADRRYAQRAQLAASFRRGALDVQLSGGLDVHRNGDAAAGFPDTTTALYRASVGYKSPALELAGGIAATAALGDELMTTPDDPSDQRAPYTLEARSYGFVRAFATRGAWFAGFDGEVDVHGFGARALVQIGASR